MQGDDESYQQIHLQTEENNINNEGPLHRRYTTIPARGSQRLKKIQLNRRFENDEKEIRRESSKRQSKLLAVKSSVNVKSDRESSKYDYQFLSPKRHSQKKKVTIVVSDSSNNNSFKSDQTSTMTIKEAPLQDTSMVTNIEKIRNFIKQTNFDQHDKKRKKELVVNDNIKQVIDEIYQGNLVKQNQLERYQVYLMHLVNLQNNQQFNESSFYNPDFSNYSFSKMKNPDINLSKKGNDDSFFLFQQNQYFGLDMILESDINKNSAIQKQQTQQIHNKKGRQYSSENPRQQARSSVLNMDDQNKKLMNFAKRNSKLQFTEFQLQDQISSHIERVKVDMKENLEKQEQESYYEQTLKMMENRYMQQIMEMNKKLHELESVNCTIKKTNESLEGELKSVRLQKKLIRYKKEQINEELNEKDIKYTQTLNQQNIVQIEIESELVTLIKEYEEFNKKEKEVKEKLKEQAEEMDILEYEYNQRIANKAVQDKQRDIFLELDEFITIKLYSDRMEDKLYNIQQSIFEDTEDEEESKLIEDQKDNNEIKNENNDQDNLNREEDISKQQDDDGDDYRDDSKVNAKLSHENKESSQEILHEFRDIFELEENSERKKTTNKIIETTDEGERLDYEDFVKEYKDFSYTQERKKKESSNSNENIINESIQDYKDSKELLASESYLSELLGDLNEESVNDTSIYAANEQKSKKQRDNEFIEDWKSSSLSSVAISEKECAFSNQQLNKINSHFGISQCVLSSQEKLLVPKKESKQQLEKIQHSSQEFSIKNLSPVYNHVNEESHCDPQLSEMDKEFQKTFSEKKNKSLRFAKEIIKKDKKKKGKYYKMEKLKKKKKQKKVKKKNKNNKKNLKKKVKVSAKTLNSYSRKSSICVDPVEFNLEELPNDQKTYLSMAQLENISKKYIESEIMKIQQAQRRRNGQKNLYQRVKEFMELISDEIDMCLKELTDRYTRGKELYENQQINQSKLVQRKIDLTNELEELNSVPIEVSIENKNTLNFCQTSLFDRGIDNKSIFSCQPHTMRTLKNIDSKTDLQINQEETTDGLQEVKNYKQKMAEREYLMVAEIYNIEKTQFTNSLIKAQRVLSLFQQDMRIVHFRISRAISNLADRIGNKQLQALLSKNNNLINKLNEKANSLLKRDINFVRLELQSSEFSSHIKLDHQMRYSLIQLFTQRGHIFNVVRDVISFFFPFCEKQIAEFISQFKNGYYLLRFCKKVDILCYIFLVQNNLKGLEFFVQTTKDEHKSMNSTATQSTTKTKFNHVITKLANIGMLTNFLQSDSQSNTSILKLKFIKPFEEFSEEEQKNIQEVVLTELYNQFPNLLQRAMQNYYQIAIERTNQLINLISTLQKHIQEIKSTLKKNQNSASNHSSSSCISQRNISIEKEKKKISSEKLANQKKGKKDISGMSKKNSHLDENDFKKLEQYDFNYGQDWQKRLNFLHFQAYSQRQVKRMNSYMGINKYEIKESLTTIDDIHHIIKKDPSQVNIKELVKEQIYNLHYINDPQIINLGEEYENFNSLRKQVKQELKEKEKLFVEAKQKKQEKMEQQKKIERYQFDLLQKLRIEKEEEEELKSEGSVQNSSLRSKASILWQKSLSPIRIVNMFSKMTKPKTISTENKENDKCNYKELKTNVVIKNNQPKTPLETKITKLNSSKSNESNKTKISIQPLEIPKKNTQQLQPNPVITPNSQSQDVKPTLMKSLAKESQFENHDTELMDAIKKIAHYKKDFKKAKENGINKHKQEIESQKQQFIPLQLRQNNILASNERNSISGQQQYFNQQQQQQMQESQIEGGSHKVINTSPLLQAQQPNSLTPKNHLEKIKVRKSFAAYFQRKQYEKNKELEEEIIKLYKHSDNYYQQSKQDITNLSMDDTFYNYLNTNNTNRNQDAQLPQIGCFQLQGEKRRDPNINNIWHIINKLQTSKKVQNIMEQNQRSDQNPQHFNHPDFSKRQSHNNNNVQLDQNSPKNRKSRVNIEPQKLNSIKIVKHPKNKNESKANKFINSLIPAQKELEFMPPTSPRMSKLATDARSLSPLGTAKYSPLTQSKFKIESVLPQIKSKHSSFSPIRKKQKKSLHFIKNKPVVK